jgi:hypothetical protein
VVEKSMRNRGFDCGSMLPALHDGHERISAEITSSRPGGISV